ncbi:hypothetical protein PR048_019661 [Dryococelus australis]|uniref:Uncharacterized protein n=1 Tax=Dryococelus australis TaxID=614101 RepID=A0ABQ9H473_9NEOP|nr:hypothetical protein PR048_019661 [Dryococelus australis]
MFSPPPSMCGKKTFLDNPFTQNQLVPKCRKILALPQHRMIQEVSTRWNSTLHMVKQLSEQKNAIIMARSRKDATISAELMTVIPLMQVTQRHLEIPSPKGTGMQVLRNNLMAWLMQEFSFIHTN